MSLEIKIIAVLVLLGALAGSLWLVDRHGYDRGIAACQAQQAKADKVVEAKHETTVVAADAGMQKAIDTGQQQQEAAQQQTQTVIRTITKVIHDAPSPPTCTVQPDSLRALTDAADRANGAADRLSGKGSGAAPANAGSAAQP